jgi:tRNA splicing ligase
MERFVIIEESAIEDMIDSFPNGFNKHIYCVSTKPSNDNSNDSNIELNFNDFDYVINSKSDLNEFHKYLFVFQYFN